MPRFARPFAFAIAFSSCFLSSACSDGSSPRPAGPPVVIELATSTPLTGVVGTQLLPPLAVRVVDARGQGVPGVEVAFFAFDGAGKVTPISPRTGADGIATAAWLLPTSVHATAAVRASFSNPATGAADTIVAYATLIPDAPASINLITPGIKAATGRSFGPVRAILADRYGNRTPGIAVSWTATGGRLDSSQPVTDSLGTAAASLTLGTTPGPNTIRVTAGALAQAITIEGVTVGVPTAMTLYPVASHGGLGAAVSVSAYVFDELGNPAPGAAVHWQVSSGGGSVSPSSTTTDVDGRSTAQFTLGSNAGMNTISVTVDTMTREVAVEGRLTSAHLTTLEYPGVSGINAGGYGIARTRAGRFVVALQHRGMLQTFLEASPATRENIDVGGGALIVSVDQQGAVAWASLFPANAIASVDLATHAVVRTAVPNAHTLVLSPAGDRVYVASHQGQLYSVSTATHAVVDSLAIAAPWGFAFSDDATDSLMYVTTPVGYQITEVDTKTLTVRRTFDLCCTQHGIVITSDHRTLYVAASGRVLAVDVASGQVVGSVEVGGAFGIAIAPDGNTLYVTTDGGKIAVLDAPSLTIEKIYETDGLPREIVVSPDGGTAWAANGSGWVDVVTR